VSNGGSALFKTGTPPSNIPVFTVPVPPNADTSVVDKVVLSDFINFGGLPGYPTATDLFGNVIWYYAALNDSAQQGALLTRAISGGTMLVIANGANSSNSSTTAQLLREIDLAGNTLRETNASRINEQLIAMGQQSECVTGGTVCLFGNFHHEAIRLPNGHTIALGDVEKMFPAGTQGSPVPVDIIGDIIVELDQNLQVVWFWNAFDHMDVNRAALLGETCSPTTGGCSRLYLATTGNDWLHANALQYTADHNLIMSVRHQDWVIKIDYRDGAGTGNVLWRLGEGGDFSIVSSDPLPWFSHQHDAGIESNGVMTVFDNGNTRVAQNPNPPQNSRGQAYILDEVNLIATQVLNSDLGVYSFALGSAQLLSNGNYHFLPGLNSGPSGNFSQSVEVLPTGVVNYRLQTPTVAYRSFRLRTLYAAPDT
jgi:arylsulfate sulfotransferase